MTFEFDQKEDLRQQMMELEKKLAESEEERCKLEKTCNVLMRAFREEEKMHYKALNKKYEKFLEDCTFRRRRNDIILKTLSRIEDRARALFAKTERLKSLKDRYFSYVKINSFKNDEPTIPRENFWTSLPSQTIQNVLPKAVHWKSPYTSDVMRGLNQNELTELERSSFSKFSSTGGNLYGEYKENFIESVPTPRRTLEHQKSEEERVKHQNLWQKPLVQHVDEFDNKNILGSTQEKYKPQKNQTYSTNSIRNGENKYDNTNFTLSSQNANFKDDLTFRPSLTNREMKVLGDKPENKESREDAAKREKIFVMDEKFKKGLSVECDEDVGNDKKMKNIGDTENVIEKDEVEMNEKNVIQKNHSKAVSENFNRLLISERDISSYNELKNDAIDLRSNYLDEDGLDREAQRFPLGLDGVDYQNETYPESYYEQPVHQNHTSIASDVILEEDETEQDIDQHTSDEKGKSSNTRNLGSVSEPQFGQDHSEESNRSSERHSEKEVVNSPDQALDPYDETREVGSREETFIKIDSTSFEGDEQSQKSDNSPKSEKNNKRTPRSNLMHLLESDSESFQIEHGDLATGNEDSDFDFSFNPN